MATQLEALVSRVAELDATLASDITLQLKHAARDREFGLVFNRHMPEMVELYGRVVRRGDKVRVAGEQPLYTVARTSGRGAERVAVVVSTTTAEVREHLVSDLVVVADFDDPIYPGLKSTGRVERGGDKPFHAVINAENFHALRALHFTHHAKVDCIYIDPPYNTGGDLTYNDKRVAREDANRHSKWLSFMERRLKLAKELLKPTGVIIAAIDDNEHAYLKLLMDRIFGESNFIANLVWDAPTTHAGKTAVCGFDYMLVYAKDTVAHLTALTEGKWQEPVGGKDELLRVVERVRQGGGTQSDAEKRLKEWTKKARSEGIVSAGTAMFTKVDDDWRVFTTGDLTGPSVRPNLAYPITDPDTGKVYPPPSGGRTAWAWSKERMEQAIKDGRVYFGGSTPRLKVFLEDKGGVAPNAYFYTARSRATRALEDIFNERRFDYPKDTTVLARWIGIVTGNNPDAVVLDFFGGSGSTMHAVMDMNAADDGRRQCILVTNNEVNAATEKELIKAGHRKGDPEWEAQGIHSRVTRPRIETVVTGVREDGSHYSEGLSENVEFFDLTYEDAERVGLGHAYEAVSPLLWLRAGATGERIPITDGFAVTDTYAVLFNPDRWKPFTTALRGKDIRCVYVVTDTDAVFERVKEHLPAGVDTVRLYEDFLSTFKFTTGS